MFAGEPDRAGAMTEHGPGRIAGAAAPRSAARGPVQCYGTIVVVGGGCYGSYYLRQLRRAADAGALEWRRLVVVDRDPECRAGREHGDRITLATSEWAPWFAEFLAAASRDAGRGAGDAIVPSPLMPHLLFDWLVDRARTRWPAREVAVRPVGSVPTVPWQRSSADGTTQFVSFAEWMCPINCIEPARCPATRGARTWTMPAAIADFVEAERRSGHNVDGPFVFHCTHRAYGVGMIDVGDVVGADAAIGEIAAGRPGRFIIGTASHCHGALGRLEIV